METLTYPQFNVHDVLQRTRFRSPQKNSMYAYGPFPDQFIENMKPWHGHPVTLLTLAEGCGQQEWVNYIKDHPEWSVQCHGWSHVRYDALPEYKCRNMLSRAKEALEATFDRPVTQYYPPFNGYNDMTRKVATELGMEEMRAIRKPGFWKGRPHRCFQVDFHYWAPDLRLARYMQFYHTMKPLFIVGAPRSGTTALMRWYGVKDPDALMLKESEKPWHRGQDMKRWYAMRLANSGKHRLIDKNCRNAMRILDIQEMFPQAEFVHIIRDGRAVANSWKKWAVKTKKTDQNIEAAALQWVSYVTYVLEHCRDLNCYRELRYEQMCRDEPQAFQSRNEKWKKELTDDEIAVVHKIQGPLLSKLGYL